MLFGWPNTTALPGIASQLRKGREHDLFEPSRRWHTNFTRITGHSIRGSSLRLPGHYRRLHHLVAKRCKTLAPATRNRCWLARSRIIQRWNSHSRAGPGIPFFDCLHRCRGIFRTQPQTHLYSPPPDSCRSALRHRGLSGDVLDRNATVEFSRHPDGHFLNHRYRHPHHLRRAAHFAGHPPLLPLAVRA